MKNALITGATKGMGRSIAVAFAKEGVNLAVCSRNEMELAQFKTQLLEINPAIRVFTQVADGSVKEQLLKFAAAAEQELRLYQHYSEQSGHVRPGQYTG